jgi:hypothetical protein
VWKSGLSLWSSLRSRHRAGSGPPVPAAPQFAISPGPLPRSALFRAGRDLQDSMIMMITAPLRNNTYPSARWRSWLRPLRGFMQDLVVGSSRVPVHRPLSCGFIHPLKATHFNTYPVVNFRESVHPAQSASTYPHN